MIVEESTVPICLYSENDDERGADDGVSVTKELSHPSPPPTLPPPSLPRSLKHLKVIFHQPSPDDEDDH